MLRLQSNTSPQWIAQAVTQIDTLLIDHAHCEKKAASTALNLIFRYPEHSELLRPLSELAREELEHFELMLGVIRARGGEYRRLKPSAYAGKLMSETRRDEPHKLLDTLICCALIEARSCERMKLLSEALTEDDPELSELYGSLLASEARHHSLYLDLASQLFNPTDVKERLHTLALHESEVLSTPAEDLRMHS